MASSPLAQSQTAVLGRFRCRQQLWNAALRQEASVQIGRIYTCRLPGKGIQRGGLCTHQQLGRGNRCHRHRPHEALCMGQVLQGFGKKKKNRHRAKETRQTTFQAEGTESAGTVLEEHGAYPKKETAHPHPAAPVHGRKRRIEPAYPGKGGPGNYQHFKPITIWTKFLSQSWNRLHRKCRNSLSSTRTTDNWKWEQKKTSTRSLSLVY